MSTYIRHAGSSYRYAAAKTVQQLVDIGGYIEVNQDQEGIELTLLFPDESVYPDVLVGGGIAISTAPCQTGWLVEEAYADHGWGPFLYDLALELAGSEGLMSDRCTVTDDAYDVWHYYYANRSDVTAIPLDDCRFGQVYDIGKCSRWDEQDAELLNHRYVIKGGRIIPKLKELGLWRDAKTATAQAQLIRYSGHLYRLSATDEFRTTVMKQAKQHGFDAWLADWDPDAVGEYEEDYLDEYLGEYSIEVHEDTDALVFDTLDDDSTQLIGDLPVVLVHHTATGALEGIKERGGLVPALTLGLELGYRESGAYVFLTTETGGPAVQGYQDRAVQRYGGDPVMLEIKTTLSSVFPDPDDEDISSGRRQFATDFVPQGWILS